MSAVRELNVKRSVIITSALAMAISAGALSARAQNQSNEPPADPQSTVAPYGNNDAQQNPRPGAYNGPRHAPPPDDYGQGPDQQDGGPRYGGGPRANYGAPREPRTPAPATLLLPAGTIISVRTEQWLSTDRNHPGDTFSAILDEPLVVDGWVVARRGQSLVGRVAVAEKAGHGKKDSQLGLELAELALVDGQRLPVNTQLVQYSAGGPSSNQKVGTVAVTTILGAAIGAVAGGGTGAAIGAGVGAGAGTVGVLATHNGPTRIGPETRLSFRLESPVEISTERSQMAFQPVSQRDYARDQDAYGRGPRSYAPGPAYGYPPPAYYYGDYCGPWISCYPYAGFYPGVSFGFYRGFGGYRGGFRGGFRR